MVFAQMAMRFCMSRAVIMIMVLAFILKFPETAGKKDPGINGEDHNKEGRAPGGNDRREIETGMHKNGG